MSTLAIPTDHLLELAGAVCNQSATGDDLVELDALLAADPLARDRYASYCRLHIALRLQLRACQATEHVHEQIGFDGVRSVSVAPEILETEPLASLPLASSRLGFLGKAFLSLRGQPLEESPFASVVALVVMAIVLVVASVIPKWHLNPAIGRHHGGGNSGGGNSGGGSASGYGQNASVPKTVTTPTRADRGIIARITGMVDCKWVDPDNAPFGPNVFRGRTYALASGLMEITYDTGAKVLLQGPVTYEVKSKDGGYLSLGKLTARVDNPKSQIQNPKFVVTTPAAVVTDLGTEFGVEVSLLGATEAHVLVGVVEVARGYEGRAVETIRLVANQAVHIDSAAAPARRLPGIPGRFVTALPRPEKHIAPVAWYKFDEVTGNLVLRTPDSSGHHRSATVQMDDAALVPGKIGSALKFNIDLDGQGVLNQRLTLPWSPAFDMVGQSFTIALWLNRVKAGVDEHETIFHKEGTEGGYSIMRDRDSGNLVFRARNAAGQWAWIRSDATGDDAPEGVWVHFAVVAKYQPATDSYNVRIYRDGVRVGGQDGVDLATLPLPLSIGGLENGWAFRGLLDDVQVYHQALNDGQMRSLFEHPGELPLVNPSSTEKGGDRHVSE
jgi:hypothetical protein